MIRRIRSDILIALILFAGCLAVYNATLTPSLSYKSPDGNELATLCYTLGLAHSTGYPLYTWLGKLFTLIPIGDVAHRVNLMSATLGAAGVALLYAILRMMTAGAERWTSRIASLFTALLFGFSRTLWSQTGIAEVYAPNVFLLALTLTALILWARAEERDRAARPAGEPWQRTLLPSWRSRLLLFVFGLCFGLSLGTHMSNLGFAPAFALFILLVSWRTTFSPAGLISAGGGFLLGLLQFLWLPYKASTLSDRLMRAHAPTSLRGIYDYTLGAFPQFKFAFPLAAIPDRIVIYLDLLRQQFGLWGIGLGILGLWVLLWRRPKRFFLVAAAYLIHIWFFVQYNVFDLDVFFIPGHLLYAIFIGLGVHGLLESLSRLVKGRQIWRVVLAIALIVIVPLPIAWQLADNWEDNDYSSDTAINDFYDNVFEMLPQDTVLLGRSGVFGYDMFYYRLVYDVRPDVLMPHLSGAEFRTEDLAGREMYANTRLDSPAMERGPWAPPSGLTDGESWHIPLLLGGAPQSSLGGTGSLVLYRISERPPDIIVNDAEPQVEIEKEAGGWILVGYDLESREVEAGGTFHLTLYWRTGEAPRKVLFSTLLDGAVLETHEPGMGNLQRVSQITQPSPDDMLVEEYWVVVPSTTEAGTAMLSIGVGSPFQIPRSDAEGSVVVDLDQVTILAGE